MNFGEVYYRVRRCTESFKVDADAVDAGAVDAGAVDA